MIQRYTRPEMGKIWSEENKYNIWLEIELLVCEAQAELGIIPNNVAIELREKSKIQAERILEIEETTKHDVIAFLTNLEENVGEISRYVHLGMTSSDVLDTCFALQSRQAGKIIINELKSLKEVLRKKALEFKHTLCVGRTHGIHAEPTTFGLKLALWHDECKRNINRMEIAVEEISYGKINGAVGTYEHITPFVEKFVMEKLELKPCNVSTQVVQRDHHAMYLSTIAVVGTMLEKIATEVRHLQKTEVLEAEEYFSVGQKGSSAMPHKRNPIASENICGQARLLRANAIAGFENNVLWHERDITHSSVERIIFPDSTISLDYILNRTIKLIDNLIVYPENMKKNLELTKGLVFSQSILLELAKKGLKRQVAYESVQKSAMKTWIDKNPFIDNLLENKELLFHITEDEIRKLFNFERIFNNVDFIFERCGI